MSGSITECPFCPAKILGIVSSPSTDNMVCLSPSDSDISSFFHTLEDMYVYLCIYVHRMVAIDSMYCVKYRSFATVDHTYRCPESNVSGAHSALKLSVFSGVDTLGLCVILGTIVGLGRIQFSRYSEYSKIMRQSLLRAP